MSGIPFLKRVSNINGTSNEIASYPMRLCLCVLNQPDCSFEPSPIFIKKGETFNISIVAVDQINHLVASDVMAFLSSKVGGLKEGQQQQSVSTTCTDLSYTVTTPYWQENEELVLNPVGPCGSAHPFQKHFQLVFLIVQLDLSRLLMLKLTVNVTAMQISPVTFWVKHVIH